MVKTAYDHCLYECNENPRFSMECKQNCFKNVMVPFHMIKHQARDAEENLYKQCLAEKTPNLKKEHYIECTKALYDQRVEMLLNHFGKVSQDTFEKLGH